MLPYHAHFVKGFGEQFKEQVRSLQPGYCFLGCFGKVLAKYENRLTVDPSQTDNFGIPIPVVHFRFGDNDMALWRDMIRTSGEILDTAKVRLSLPGELHPAGFASHDVGTVRMGNDPKTSVLNSFCQTHEVKNLFVVDGSCFTTAPEKNPTLTIMALAVRTAHHMADAIRKGDL
jgi:choline dehydrogenase-like flavoprotein